MVSSLGLWNAAT